MRYGSCLHQVIYHFWYQQAYKNIMNKSIFVVMINDGSSQTYCSKYLDVLTCQNNLLEITKGDYI